MENGFIKIKEVVFNYVDVLDKHNFYQMNMLTKEI